MASSLALSVMVKCPVNQSISNHLVPHFVPRQWRQIHCVCATKSLQKFGLAVNGWPAAGPSQVEPETCRPEPGANSHCSRFASGEADGPQAPTCAASSQSSD